MYSKLYTDTMTVYRADSIKSGYTYSQSDGVVYANVACRVSNKKGIFASASEAPYDSSRFGDIRMQVKLFHDPSVVVLAGDRVVAAKNGVILEGLAGDSFRYDRHSETVLFVHKVA